MASDRIFGLVATLMALAYIASATQIETSFLSDPVGPKSFPILIGIVAAICGGYMMLKPDLDPAWPKTATWIGMGTAVVVLAFYAVLLTPLGFILPTMFAAGLLSYQISNRALPSAIAGICLSLGLFIVFKFGLGLGNIVAYRIPSLADLWKAISILIPFVGH